MIFSCFSGEDKTGWGIVGKCAVILSSERSPVPLFALSFHSQSIVLALLHKLSSSDKIHLALLTATILGLGIAIFHNGKQHTSLLQQMKLASFTDYTKRYEQIVLSFPEEIHQSDFQLTALEKADRDYILKYMRAYFDLCSEEYYLYTSDLIEQRIWELWEAGIAMNLSKPAFRQAWFIVSEDTAFDPSFLQLMNRLARSGKATK